MRFICRQRPKVWQDGNPRLGPVIPSPFIPGTFPVLGKAVLTPENPFHEPCIPPPPPARGSIPETPPGPPQHSAHPASQKKGGFGVTPVMVCSAEHHGYPLPRAEAPPPPHPPRGQDGDGWRGEFVGENSSIGVGVFGDHAGRSGVCRQAMGRLCPLANHPCWIMQTGWLKWGKQQGLHNFKRKKSI